MFEIILELIGEIIFGPVFRFLGKFLFGPIGAILRWLISLPFSFRKPCLFFMEKEQIKSSVILGVVTCIVIFTIHLVSI